MLDENRWQNVKLDITYWLSNKRKWGILFKKFHIFMTRLYSKLNYTPVC